jgi:hypothetical protein
MRKQITIATLVAYSVLTHYCLVYAMVTGNTHHATAIFADLRTANEEVQETHHQSTACHSNQAANDSSRGNDNESKNEDPCCITFFQNVPGIVSGGVPIPDSPVLALLPTGIPGAAISPAIPIVSRQNDRGPPIPASQFFSLSHRSPRAPPLASL